VDKAFKIQPPATVCTKVKNCSRPLIEYCTYSSMVAWGTEKLEKYDKYKYII